MSAIRPLSGVAQTWRGHPSLVEIDLGADLRPDETQQVLELVQDPDRSYRSAGTGLFRPSQWPNLTFGGFVRNQTVFGLLVRYHRTPSAVIGD
jgi:hypothetical protein